MGSAVTSASLGPGAALPRQRRATWRVWQEDARTRPAGGWADLGGLVVHATGIPVRHWNGAHLLEPSGTAALDACAAWFARRGLPWGVLVPSELDLEPPGLRHLLDQPLMLRDLEALPPLPDLDLRWGTTSDAARVQAEAFGDALADVEALLGPKRTNAACGVVTAYDGSTPVSTATVVVADGVAGVFGVGTVASHRRQGLGAAVTLAALHEAARRGCDLAYLNPSELGYGVYAALGFTDAPPWRVWVPDEG